MRCIAIDWRWPVCSASSINEWTGERTLRDEDVAEDVRPASVQPLGQLRRADHLAGRLQPGALPSSL